MVHISQLADYRVPSVEEVVQLGDEITVMVTDIDPGGQDPPEPAGRPGRLDSPKKPASVTGPVAAGAPVAADRGQRR